MVRDAAPLSSPMPQYRRVKEHILHRIETGAWQPGDRIPSENRLVQDMNVSRMTVNRAVRELAQDGILVRVPGTGTFVAAQQAPTDLLELRNIADQIRESGHQHHARLELLQVEAADNEVAFALDLERGATVFHSILVHLSDGEPVQIEDRFVDPAAAPDYMQVDFTRTTPNEHLTRVAPATEVEHVVEAIMPSRRMRRLLEMPSDEPCLQLRRRTWSGQRVVTYAKLLYKGSSQRFRTRFSYGRDARVSRASAALASSRRG